MSGTFLTIGKTPAVALVNPKYDHNVGGALRACAAFGMKQLWYTGNRVPDVTTGVSKGKYRLPREERMKGYRAVDISRYDRFFDCFQDYVPVAIERKGTHELLDQFEHPENALYVFGPEDGSLGKGIVEHCHRFVRIRTRFCLNLAAAVNLVLFHRCLQRGEFPDDEREE